MTLLVTGASGFLGSHVVRAAAERGLAVRGLVRPSSDRSLLAGARADVAVGDLTDAASLRAAVAGVTAVVHCAATTSEASPDYALSYRTNVTGTQDLIDACIAAGVGRFILISTQSANAQNTSAYGRTKLEAERLVAASPLRCTTLRPSTIYGPGARGLFAKMSQYVERLPVIPIIGDGRQRFRPIHVGDVAAAVLSCLDAERTVGRTYDLGGADGVSFEEFLDGIGAAAGKRRAKVHLPIPLCVAGARVLGLVAKNPPLTLDNIVGLTQMRECDIDAARADFGFSPRTFRQGMGLSANGGARLEEERWARESR